MATKGFDRVLRIGALFLSLAVGVSAHAEQVLQVNSAGSVFGLPAHSASSAFIEKLGQPTAEVKMGATRRGLMFGNSMLLVFANDRLVQVRCWLVPEFTSDLYLGWLQEVKGYQRGFELDGQLSLGLNRSKTSPFIDDLPGSADERSTVVEKGSNEVWLGYGPAADYRLGDEDEQVINSITVNFKAPAASLTK